MENALYVSFQLKRKKLNTKGLVPIYLRITVNSKRVELSTHRSISPELWDHVTGYPSGNNNDSRILKNYLDTLRTKVYKQFNILESLDKEITAIDLKNRLLNKDNKKQSILKVFDYHNNHVKQKVGPDFSEVTYKHYKATYKKVESFTSFEYKKNDLLLDDLKYSFITRFELSGLSRRLHFQGRLHVPLAPVWTSTGGLTFDHPSGWGSALRYRYMRDRPADELNSVKALGYTVLDGRINYTYRKWTFGIYVENLFNVDWSEAQFAGDYRVTQNAEPGYGLTYTPGTPFFLKAGVCLQF